MGDVVALNKVESKSHYQYEKIERVEGVDISEDVIGSFTDQLFDYFGVDTKEAIRIIDLLKEQLEGLHAAEQNGELAKFQEKLSKGE
ncbi:hypothetical protein [Paenibacillus sp. FSL E2-0151]|uniref:hypothetical protein n=1 Tax=Paenibacillus sp. FSL E2-0151 TaxID=2921357 RepID=UPI0030ED95BE